MRKTLSSINKDLKSGRTVIVAVEQRSEAQQDTSAKQSPPVDAVTTATFGNYSHRIPVHVPPPLKKQSIVFSDKSEWYRLSWLRP
jgi:uncharacterized protein (DUF39 family)